jgi:hypothetical protein
LIKNYREIINWAIWNKEKVTVTYRDYYGQITNREVLPIEWLTPEKFKAYCYLRESERIFRLSNLVNLTSSFEKMNEPFPNLQNHTSEKLYSKELIVTEINDNEEEILQKKLDDLKQILAGEELILATLKAELIIFEKRYSNQVGKLFEELDELDAKIAEIYYKLHPTDFEAKENFDYVKDYASHSENDPTSEKEELNVTKHFKTTETLRSLYHKVAKLIHPDLAIDPLEKEMRNEWMREVNSAFEMNDEDTIKKILEDCEKIISKQKPILEFKCERLRKLILQIQLRIQSIKRELQILKQSELYLLMLKVKEAEINGVDLLADMAKGVKEKIIDRKNTFEILSQELKKETSSRDQFV